MGNYLISRSVAIEEFYKRISGDLTIDDVKYIEKVLNEVHAAVHVDKLIDKFSEIITKYREIRTPDEFQESMRFMRSHGNSGWIPCERELPGALDIDPDLDPEDIMWPEYMVTIKGASDATALYYNFQEGIWFDINGNMYKVVAWRPMPDAYRPQKKAINNDYKQQIMDRFLKFE